MHGFSAKFPLPAQLFTMEKNQMKRKLRHEHALPASTLHTVELQTGTMPAAPVYNAYYHLLLERKAVLNTASEQLKATFIGLDSIIDELMGLVSSWYLFPEAQLRPMVVNLWGLTGSGKTALVKQLVRLLDFQKRYIQVDMGEFESDSATWFRKTLTGDMEYLNEQPCIMCLDEFQFARTLDNQGNEMGKDKLRFVWDLVDSGKLTYTPPTNAYCQTTRFFDITAYTGRGVFFSENHALGNKSSKGNDDVFT